MNTKNLFIAASVILSSVFATSCQKGSDDQDENYERTENQGGSNIVVGHGDQMIAGFYANETVFTFCEPYFLFEHNGQTDSISINDSRVVKDTYFANGEQLDYYSVAKEIKDGSVKITVNVNPKADFDQLFKDNCEGKSNLLYYGTATGNAKIFNAAARQQLAKYGMSRTIKTKATCTPESFHVYFERMKDTKTIE